MAENRARAAALSGWGAELRAGRLRRRRLRGRYIVVGLLVFGLVATLAFPSRPVLVWNASASAPVGLYLLGPGATPEVGAMVIARVPERYRSLAARRHYLPANVPLVKRVAAAPGDHVCAVGRGIYVDGIWVAWRRAVDGRGRLMPWWRGCVTLPGGALLLLMDDPASFDGRYFGPTEGKDVIGAARLLWPV